MTCGVGNGLDSKLVQPREKQWMERLQQVQDDERAPGMDSYCHKQVALWTTLAKQANKQFSALLGHLLLNLLS